MEDYERETLKGWLNNQMVDGGVLDDAIRALVKYQNELMDIVGNTKSLKELGTNLDYHIRCMGKI